MKATQQMNKETDISKEYKERFHNSISKVQVQCKKCKERMEQSAMVYNDKWLVQPIV